MRSHMPILGNKVHLGEKLNNFIFGSNFTLIFMPFVQFKQILKFSIILTTFSSHFWTFSTPESQPQKFDFVNTSIRSIEHSWAKKNGVDTSFGTHLKKVVQYNRKNHYIIPWGLSFRLSPSKFLYRFPVARKFQILFLVERSVLCASSSTIRI